MLKKPGNNTTEGRAPNKEGSALAMSSAANFGHQTARNQVIKRVAITVNIYCMLNLRQALL